MSILFLCPLCDKKRRKGPMSSSHGFITKRTAKEHNYEKKRKVSNLLLQYLTKSKRIVLL